MKLGKILAVVVAMALVVVCGAALYAFSTLQKKVDDAVDGIIPGRLAEVLGLNKVLGKIVSSVNLQHAEEAVPLIVSAAHDSAPGRSCPEVTPALIAAQIYHESGYNPQAESGVGARGMAQFMPGTWTSSGIDGNGDGRRDPNDPEDAIPSMVKYNCSVAKDTRKIPGDPVKNMLAGYNAGPLRVQQYRGIPPYAETQAYVARIMGTRAEFSAAIAAAAAAEGPQSTFGNEVVAQAARWIGTPYQWGGGDRDGPTRGLYGRENGFDCSGLVLYAVYHARARFQVTPNRVLPHQTLQQIKDDTGREVPLDKLQPGDIVFVRTNKIIYTDPGHVVIYAGVENGTQMIIEAPRTGLDVRKVPLSNYRTTQLETVRRYG